MKSVFLNILLFIALSIMACSSKPVTPQSNTTISEASSTLDTNTAASFHDSAALQRESSVIQTISIQPILTSYLDLKNALVADNAQAAAKAGKAMVTAIDQVNTAPLSTEQHTAYKELADDAREQAEHISENASNIKHQREHFDMLSQDIYQLAKQFTGAQNLYYDFCPMYNDGKGGYWLSENEEITNPYFGKKMLKCGSVKETLK